MKTASFAKATAASECAWHGIDSFAPARLFDLPIYVARIPAAPFAAPDRNGWHGFSSIGWHAKSPDRSVHAGPDLESGSSHHFFGGAAILLRESLRWVERKATRAGRSSRATSGSVTRRKSSLVDDLVLLPWWVSAGLSPVAFLVLSAALPPSMAGLALMIPVFLILIAGISALRSWKTARTLEQQTGIDSLRELPWKRFEDLLGEAYRRQGYQVEEALGKGADGGVDLVLRRDGAMALVQCKRWKGKPVPVQTVRELFGVLHDRGAASAKLVATTRFTPDAIAFAKGKPIELVDSDAILHLLRGVQTSGRIVAPTLSREPDARTSASAAGPLCPSGHGLMVKRTARRGENPGSKFWGCCEYPRCCETRAI